MKNSLKYRKQIFEAINIKMLLKLKK